MWLASVLRRGGHIPLHVRVIAAVLVMCLLLLSLDGWRTWQMRGTAIATDRMETANLARSLAQHAHDTLSTADLLVFALRERIEAGELSPERIAGLERLIAVRLPTVPALSGLAVFDATGTEIAGERDAAGRPLTDGDRAYFAHHRDNPDRGVFIGDAIRSRADGQWSITVSRRLDDSRGRFAGVVRARISATFLERFYGSFSIGSHGVITLISSRATVIARAGGTRAIGTGAINGMNVSSSPAFRRISAGQLSGSTFGRSPVDGVTRLGSFRKVDDYPIFVLVAHALDQVLAAWRADAALHLAVSLLVSTVLVVAGSRFARQVRIRQRAEQRYRLLSENSSDAIVCITLDGRRSYVSPAFTVLTGWNHDEAVAGEMADIIHPDDRQLAADVPRRLLAGPSQVTLCFRYIRRDGTPLWVEARARLLRGDGQDAQVIANVRDITDRRVVEAVLHASERRYRMLADNTSDVILCLDRDLRCTYASPACRSVLGHEPGRMQGAGMGDIVHPDDVAAVLRSIRPLLTENRERARITYRARHATGSWTWVEATVDAVRDQPADGVSLVLSLRDISERYAQAEALQTANGELHRLARHLARARDGAEKASQAKSRFLAGMSHEFRTPLNGILGYAELMRLDGDLDARQLKRVGAMLEAGEHLLQMINRVLDLSEIENETVTLTEAGVDLPALARACIDLVEPVARAKILELDLVIAPSTPDRMVTDAGRLRQILLNLLGNAIKFTSRGSVRLHLRPLAGSGVRIEVADTGPGIAPELRSRLFQKFERLGAKDTGIEGAGLGLALSAQLAAMLGTRIEHRNHPSGGSVFSLDLLQGASNCPVAPPSPTETASPMNGGEAMPARSRVLVVDDIAMNRDITASFLRTAGHEVTLAEGGLEAVEAAASVDFDVVFMDVQMPEVDGLEATRRIRLLPGTRGLVPVVALTAQAFSEQIGHCYVAGMNAHLTKPFKQAALLTLLDRFRHPAPAGREAGITTPDRIGHPRRSRLSRAGAQADGGPAALNTDTFDGMVAMLAPETVASYLSTIRERGEALLRVLRAPDVLTRADDTLGPAAHVLAGSAGMFGFERLAAAAQLFERSAGTGGGLVHATVEALTADLEFLINEIDDRALAPVMAG